MTRRAHWNRVYSDRQPAELGWFEPRAASSLALIAALGLPPDAPLIDVGGGASVLVDDLLAAGYHDVSVLDLSAAALAASRARLGAAAARVHWLEGDVTQLPLPEARYALWHDRAVFHFLTESAQRQAYVAQARRALRPGGHLLVATFAEDGPGECSGLPVVRYDAATLAGEFGAGFALVEERRDIHRTPSGGAQPFIYCVFRRAESPPC